MVYHYETIFVTIPEITEDVLKTLRSKIEGSISKQNGEVVKIDDWGVKKLAYQIDRSKKGKYIYCNYKSEPQAVSEIERLLKLDERVLRFLTTRFEEEKPVPPKKEKVKK